MIYYLETDILEVTPKVLLIACAFLSFPALHFGPNKNGWSREVFVLALRVSNSTKGFDPPCLFLFKPSPYTPSGDWGSRSGPECLLLHPG